MKIKGEAKTERGEEEEDTEEEEGEVTGAPEKSTRRISREKSLACTS